MLRMAAIGVFLVLVSPALKLQWDRNHQLCPGDTDNAIIENCTNWIERTDLAAEVRAVSLIRRGHAWGRKGRRDHALDDFDAAVALQPDRAFTYFNRGSFLQDIGVRDKAISDFTRAIELDTDMAPAYFNRGLLKEAGQDFADAFADYTRYAVLRPSRAGDAITRAKAVEARAATKAAELESWRRAGDASRRGFDLLARQGRAEDAVTHLSVALDIMPSHVSAREHRGVAFTLLGRYDLALADQAQNIRDQGTSHTYWRRGVTFLAMGRPDLAIEDFARAWEKQPDALFAIYLYIARTHLRAADAKAGLAANVARLPKLVPHHRLQIDYLFGNIDLETMLAGAESRDYACSLHFIAGSHLQFAEGDDAARVHFIAAMAPDCRRDGTAFLLAKVALERLPPG